MRSLRSSLASDNLGVASRSRFGAAGSAVKHSAAVTAYTAVPQHKLNLVDLQVCGVLYQESMPTLSLQGVPKMSLCQYQKYLFGDTCLWLFIWDIL